MEEIDGGARRRPTPRAHVADAVLEAAREGRADELQQYLLAGRPVDGVDEFGKHVIHYAARYGMLPSLHALVAVDPRQVYASDDEGNKAVHCAAERADSVPVLQELLQFDVEVNIRNNDGLTPLHVASFCGNAPAVRVLLRHGAAVDLVTEASKTALHLAAQLGHADTVSALCELGSDVSLPTKDGYTALHLASSATSHKAVQALLVGGADEKATTDDGGTALYYAASYGRHENIEVLLHHNSDPNAADSHGRSSMHCAATHGHQAAFAPLVHGGGMLDLDDEFGNTPLHYAVMNGRVEAVCWLLQLNASPMFTNKDGETPLHVAAKRGHIKVAEQLCQHHSDVHAVDVKGDTASHKAARQGHNEVLHHLLSVGAPLNRQNKGGDTCLHLAARYNHVQCVRILLNANANMTLCNKNGDLPMATSGAVARPMLEDWVQELSTVALMAFGAAEHKDTPVLLYGNPDAGKTALFDSLTRHKSGGILGGAQTIYSTTHEPTLGLRVRHVNVGLHGRKKLTRILEVGGQNEFRPLRSLLLRVPRATHVLLLNQRQGYDELQAQASAWLDLARSCMSRVSLGRALRLRTPVLLVFSNSDHSSVRVTKNPKNNLNSTTVADRLFSELQVLYKEWFDFGTTPYIMDCRVPFSPEMDSLVLRLKVAEKALLKESLNVPRVVEKVEARLMKICQHVKSPWMPWTVFRSQASKTFFRGEDRDRMEAEVFMRRIAKVLHAELKIISFSDGPAKDFVILQPMWFFDKVLPALLTHNKRPVGMAPLTVDEQGHVFIEEFEALLAPLLGKQKMDGFLSMLSAMNLLHVLPSQELRVLMPSRIPQTLAAPQSYLQERSVFVGRRLNLAGVTARSVASLLGSVTLGLLAEFPGFTEVIWTLGMRLVRQAETAVVELSVELGEHRSNAIVLIYAVSNLLPALATEPMKNMVAKVTEIAQLHLQAEAPSVAMEMAPLNESQVLQVRRRSVDQPSGNVLAHRGSTSALLLAGGVVSGSSPRDRMSPLAARRDRLGSNVALLDGIDSPRELTPRPGGLVISQDVELEEYTRSPGAPVARSFQNDEQGVDEIG